MISDSASIGTNTYLSPGVFVGHHTTIGSNCIIHPNVTILDHCVIGDHVIIQAGTVIGSDAFYYNGKKDREIWYRKMEKLRPGDHRGLCGDWGRLYHRPGGQPRYDHRQRIETG